MATAKPLPDDRGIRHLQARDLMRTLTSPIVLA
jgi:hypothetical protein